jgi:hypothetical protein
MPGENTTLRWSAYEHEHIERGSDWYWALGVIAISVAITSLLLGDLLFSVVILLGAIVLAMLSRTPPDIAHFEISDRGVRVGGRLHRFDEVISFWVDEEHHKGRPLLLLDTVKFMSPNLIIPIEHIDPKLVRAYLKERCEEVPMKEPLAHKIFDYLNL